MSDLIVTQLFFSAGILDAEGVIVSLKIRNRRVGGVIIMDLQGKIALGEANRSLHTALRSAADSDRKDVILNLANVSVIDSSGLGELISGYTSLEKAGGSMKLLNLSERITELMTITKLHTVFEIFTDEDDAVESYHLESGPAAKSSPLYS